VPHGLHSWKPPWFMTPPSINTCLCRN
jgi:hypothetical protein